MTTSRMILYAELTLIPQSLKDRLCVMSLTTSSTMWMNTCYMQARTNYSDKPPIMSSSYPRNNFMETDAMFLEFENDLDNIAGGSSSVGDNTAHSDDDRPWSGEDYFSTHCSLQPGDSVCMQKTFFVRCLKWADVGREYIERLFVLDFNDQAMNRRPGYSKGLGWGPKPKARRMTSASSSSTSCSQSTQKEIELQAKLNEALERIEVQDRNHEALASQVERMQKLIEDFTRAQQGPPHDP
ncbi:CACTA en-spm transposon protein [Cucumis melo var. makuwa]|uniref:CACTA en-spm transposon protein n=1 Tax=Cucumis melo var. makuwa TaxID=1194695 RepID=A0A5D3DQL1_CUCMM|nr:CACTA en-spm transposon protein [Cucumis melo var. makuwa]